MWTFLFWILIWKIGAIFTPDAWDEHRPGLWPYHIMLPIVWPIGASHSHLQDDVSHFKPGADQSETLIDTSRRDAPIRGRQSVAFSHVGRETSHFKKPPANRSARAAKQKITLAVLKSEIKASAVCVSWLWTILDFKKYSFNNNIWTSCRWYFFLLAYHSYGRFMFKKYIFNNI